MHILWRIHSLVQLFKHWKVSLNFLSTIRLHVISKLQTYISRNSKNCTWVPCLPSRSNHHHSSKFFRIYAVQKRKITKFFESSRWLVLQSKNKVWQEVFNLFANSYTQFMSFTVTRSCFRNSQVKHQSQVN